MMKIVSVEMKMANQDLYLIKLLLHWCYIHFYNHSACIFHERLRIEPVTKMSENCLKNQFYDICL